MKRSKFTEADVTTDNFASMIGKFAPGNPQQNRFVESFNGKLEDERLN